MSTTSSCFSHRTNNRDANSERSSVRTGTEDRGDDREKSAAPSLRSSLICALIGRVNLTWGLTLSKLTSLFTTARVVFQNFFHSTHHIYTQASPAVCGVCLCVCIVFVYLFSTRVCLCVLPRPHLNVCSDG